MLEALLYGECDDTSAAELREHLTGCPACADEYRLLQAERYLFAERSAAHEPASVPWTAIENRLDQRNRWDALRGWLFCAGAGLAVATAALLLFWPDLSDRTPLVGARAVAPIQADAATREAWMAIDDAEAAQLAAIGAMEEYYRQHRGTLDRATANAIDEQIAQYQTIAARKPPAEMEPRLQRLNALYAHRRALQRVLLEQKEQ